LITTRVIQEDVYQELSLDERERPKSGEF